LTARAKNSAARIVQFDPTTEKGKAAREKLAEYAKQRFTGVKKSEETRKRMSAAVKARLAAIPPRYADCHPERLHKSRGMCSRCYDRYLYWKNKPHEVTR
jgi:hypothetical protein